MSYVEITAKLKDAANGLYMPSESEHPFEPFVWSDVKETLTPEKMLELTGHPQNSPVETVNLPDLFKNLAYEQEWHDDKQKENVGKYKNLLETIENNLRNVQVYRIGKRAIDVYIVGKTEEGSLAGVATKVVET
ncbi:MAG: nuclease A inhibitor family protein [Rhizonema sp. PD37]|nr:nuclease A inhibitor family protein [Rhizonema sp. PD37]